MAIDPSLTCSGWALFQIVDGQLLGVGRIRSLPPSHGLHARLTDLQAKILHTFELVELSENDVLICEDATSNLDPGAAAKIERVRGIFETLARARAMSVPGRIHPRTVQHEVMGLKGRQLSRRVVKGVARDIAVKLYGSRLTTFGFDCSEKSLLRNQDVLDAILVGSLAVTKAQNAMRCGRPLAEYFLTGHSRSNGRYSLVG